MNQFSKFKILIFALGVVSILYGNIQVNAQSSKRVLFLGNSYTAGNNLPQLVYDIALSAGDTLIFDSNSPGGMTLQGHSTNATTIAKIQSGNWDFVVLQEQSQRPSFPDAQVQADVFPYATILDSMINTHNSCAETMFFMTWGRKNGDASNCAVWPPVCTYEGMDSLLRLRYLMMAEMNDAVVSPVGAVWKHLRTHHPSIELYQGDESHASLSGTYAAALSFYTCIFREDPTNISFNSTLDVTDAMIIRNAVKTVVYDSLSKWFIDAYDPVAQFTSHMWGNTVSFTNTSEFANEFVWSFGDGNSSNDVNPIHVYDSIGNYNVTLSASFCSYSDTIEKTIILTGFEEYKNPSKMTVFPNPAKENLTVNTQISLSGTQFIIYDCIGKPILQGIFSGKNNSINIQDLQGGVYFLKIQEKDSTAQVLKFVKY
jgi:hypothetical protein